MHHPRANPFYQYPLGFVWVGDHTIYRCIGVDHIQQLLTLAKSQLFSLTYIYEDGVPLIC